jgi:hypothetical protein
LKKAIYLVLAIGIALILVSAAKPDVPPGPPAHVPGTPQAETGPTTPIGVPPPFNDESGGDNILDPPGGGGVTPL